MRKAVCGSTPQSPLKPGKSQPKRLPMSDINSDTSHLHPFFPLSSPYGNPITPTNLYQKPIFDGENRSPHRLPVDKQRKRQDESDCEKVRNVYKRELESREKLVLSLMATKESLETQVNTHLVRIAKQEAEIKSLKRTLQEMTEALERCTIEKSDLMGEVHLLECEVDRVQYENSKLREEATMGNDVQISQKLPAKELFLALESRLMEHRLTPTDKFTVETDGDRHETRGKSSENYGKVAVEIANDRGKSIEAEAAIAKIDCEVDALQVVPIEEIELLQRSLQFAQFQAVTANTKFAEIATEFDEFRKSVKDAVREIPERYKRLFSGF